MQHTKKLAVLLALSVAAFGGTACAAEYKETISGSGDNYASYIDKEDDGNGNYTYTFPAEEANSLIIKDDNSIANRTHSIAGIQIPYASTSQSITIQRALNIDAAYTDSVNGDGGYGTANGIFLNSSGVETAEKGKTITRINGGKISVSSQSGDAAMASGVRLFNGSHGTVSIGNTEMTVAAEGVETGGYADARGIEITSGENNCFSMGDGSIAVKAFAAASFAQAYGIQDMGDNSSVTLGNVSFDITAEGQNDAQEYSYPYAYGIQKANAGSMEIGEGDIKVRVIMMMSQLLSRMAFPWKEGILR